MTTSLTGRRMTYRERKLTKAERERLKADRIREAREWKPPKTVMEPLYLNPGDSGYDTAECEEYIMCGAPIIP